ncbi:MAG TPA: hypothetical protein VGU01_11200 [Sphingomicrobium sp.]|nr:hypothetical protein [Sphingomicrobium sp.]
MRFRSRLCVWGTIALLSACMGAGAEALQSPRQPIAAIIAPPKFALSQAQDCVLHVWPGSDAHSSYSGWFHGGAVDGDKRGIRGYPAMHADVLNTAAQRALLAKIDWAELRAMPGLKIVIHDAPPPPQDDLARDVPLIGNHVGCYDELLVHSVLVERATFSSRSVRVMMIAKRWRSPDWRAATYGAMSVDTVDLGAGDVSATQAALEAGFTSAIHKFIRDEHFLRR